jgi:hypothetical protein
MHLFLRMVLSRTCTTVGINNRQYWQVKKDKVEGDERANKMQNIKFCYDI